MRSGSRRASTAGVTRRGARGRTRSAAGRAARFCGPGEGTGGAAVAVDKGIAMPVKLALRRDSHRGSRTNIQPVASHCGSRPSTHRISRYSDYWAE
jgi:hypothetical protein